MPKSCYLNTPLKSLTHIINKSVIYYQKSYILAVLFALHYKGSQGQNSPPPHQCIKKSE